MLSFSLGAFCTTYLSKASLPFSQCVEYIFTERLLELDIFSDFLEDNSVS